MRQFNQRSMITFTPSKAKEYEHRHPKLQLKRLMMHMDGTDTYEILIRRQDNGTTGTREALNNS